MDRLAPIEIEYNNLRPALKGYDKSQVDAFWLRIKNEMTVVQQDLKTAKEEIQKQKEMIEAFQAQENTLKDTLLVAQRTADELRANAHREADAVLAQAHRTAEDTQRQYQSKINDLRWELERTRMDRQKFFADFRQVLDGYLRTLNDEPAGAPIGNGVVEPSENIRAAIEAPVS